MNRFTKKVEPKTEATKEYPFTRIGTMTTTENTPDELAEDLKTLDTSLWLGIFFNAKAKRLDPEIKLADKKVLRNKDRILISFGREADDPHFVVGHAMLQGDDGFVTIGSLKGTKNTDKDILVEFSKSNDLKLWFSVYLPKGVDQLEIDKDSKILLSFKTFERDPKFVVGHVLLKN